MKKHPSHSLDGATEPDFVRDLLEAGRVEHAAAASYDVEAGLARHLAQVQAGAPVPDWAQSMVKSAGAAATVGAAGSGVVKLLPWIAMSLLAVGVASIVVLGSPQSSPIAAPVAPLPAKDVRLEPEGEAHGQEHAQQGAEHSVGQEAADAIEASAADSPVEPKSSADEMLARVKRDVIARRATTRGAQSTSAKAVDTRSTDARSIDALMGANVSKGSPSEGTVQLAPRTTTARSQNRAQVDSQAESAVATKSEPVEQAEGGAPAVLDDARLEREMGMLAMAQRVLTRDPERALRLARQGEQEFAGSMFTQERQQVLLLALIQLGRMPEAKRLALPYLKRYPNGPFSDRLRRALVTGKLANEPSREADN
jgi:hypothetical protein